MGSVGSLCRAVGTVALAAVSIAGVAVATAAPASASAISEIQPVSWAFVDSTVPHTRFVQPAGDMPVGAFAGQLGVTHEYKSYVTFDLTNYKRSDVLTAQMFTDETAVTDCTTARDTQVWMTDTDTAPTWANQPTENVQLPSEGGEFGCPSPRVAWDAKAALQQAVAAGQNKVTFVFRMPDAQQGDLSFGRRYDPVVHITVNDNKAPLKPTQLTTNGIDCGVKPLVVGLSGATLTAFITDPDDVIVNDEFDWWPAAHPDQRTAIKGVAASGHTTQTEILRSQLADKTKYAWQVRGSDQLDTGPWSQVCTFTTDFTPPAVVPTVTSTDYPPTGFNGGSGVPGKFTFSPNGATGVVGYRYIFDDIVQDVPAGPDGTATVQLVPRFSFSNQLDVSSVDIAGDAGPEITYQFDVAFNAPKVTCTPATVVIGSSATCVLAPGGAGTVVSYTYTVDNGPATTVPAASDGTASITVVVNSTNVFEPVSVTANLSTNTHTEPGGANIFVDTGAPTVTQTPDSPIEGQPVQFTFQTDLPNVASYTYQWNGAPAVTVPAGSDGTATVTLTAPGQVSAELDVSATATGLVSGTTTQFVSYQPNQPTVTSTDYPEDFPAGGTTEPGTFTFSSSLPGVVSYTYAFDNAAPTTIPAGSDGTASVTFTPLTDNDHTLTVTSTFTDGTVSDQTVYDFIVKSVAPTMSCDKPSAAPGDVVTCTFAAAQPGAVSYVYSLNGATEVDVPKNPDGTGPATITIPNVPAGNLPLTVWSVNGAGLRSDPLQTAILVTITSSNAQRPSTHLS